jgi:CBS domain-containing protein
MKTDRRSFESRRIGRRARRLSALLWGIGLGTFSTYFGDRRLGRQRRALAGDKLTHVARRGNRELRKAEQNLLNRGHGFWARLRASLRAEQVDDDILVERVRSALGRACSHASAIAVHASQGNVVLEGVVLAREHLPVLRAAGLTRGVRAVEDRLQPQQQPGSIPALQDGRRRDGTSGVTARRCGAIMKTNIRTASPDETLRQAAEKMALANVGFLPVRDATGRVIGTITDRDIVVRGVAAGSPSELGRVGDVMSRQVLACRADDPPTVAEDLMAQNQVSRLVVLDDEGRLAGVISLSDLVEHEPARRVARTLRALAAREAARLPA